MRHKHIAPALMVGIMVGTRVGVIKTPTLQLLFIHRRSERLWWVWWVFCDSDVLGDEIMVISLFFSLPSIKVLI